MPKYIDVHFHLDMCKDIDQIISNAKENNIILLSNGVNIESNRKQIEFREKYNIKIALGFYPIDALKYKDEEIDEEIRFIKKQKPSAIGEVGLDFKYDIENIERQKQIFEKFILLSKELDIPIIVHSRKAELECIELLEKHNVKKVIMHCFSGKKKYVERIIKNKWFLSIPANVVNSKQFQENVNLSSLSNLFCETDSPYLHPFKKENNEPIFVIESYKKIAEIKKITIEELKNIIFMNWQGIFNN
jgi:TatD DNase family protein